MDRDGVQVLKHSQKRTRPIFSCSGRRSQRRIWFMLLAHGTDYIITLYVILLAASKQDKPNPSLWLATWAGKMALLSCPFGVSCKKMLLRMSFNKLFIDQDGLIFASFFSCVLNLTTFRSINKHKKKNITQLSWPRASNQELFEEFTKLMHSRTPWKRDQEL